MYLNKDVLPDNLPAPLQLNAKDLPWVVSATHLGHEIHQSGLMDHDTRVKRALFIDSSIEVRESFHFANPIQVLQAVQLYCLHYYGSMLWDFSSERTWQFCRAWQTCVKLVFDVPRSTHTYLVDQYFSTQFLPIRTELFSRFSNFTKNLKKSESFEVRCLIQISEKDLKSTTAWNIYTIEREIGFDPLVTTPEIIRNYPIRAEIPQSDTWRIPLLDKLLEQKQIKEDSLENAGELRKLIDSLCSS